MTIKNVPINDIYPNDARNFNLYPMNQAHVDALIESYEKNGDFGIVIVRELVDGTFEQACGHHRVEAMKQLGWTEALCRVEIRSDDEMIRIMVDENAKQKGDNAPAALDSLSAVTRQVAYYLLISDTVEDFCELICGAPRIDGVNARSISGAKGAIRNGKPVNYPLLKAYAGDGISANTQVVDLGKTLQDSGELGRIYKGVQARVEAEMAEQEAEAKAEEEARLKAEAKAEREEKAAAKAAEAAKVAAAKASKSRKAAANAAAKKAEANAKAKAKLRAEEMKRQAADRAKADEEREERKRKVREAEEAAKASKELAAGLHPDVLHMLKAHRHQAEFRKIVTSEEGQRVFPMVKQVQVVRQMLVWADDEELTTPLIREYMSMQLTNANKELRMAIAHREASQEKISTKRKVDNAIDDFRRTVNNTSRALQKLGKVLDDDVTGEYAYNTIAMDVPLGRSISDLENMVASLRAALTLREKYVTANRPVNDIEGELVD